MNSMKIKKMYCENIENMLEEKIYNGPIKQNGYSSKTKEF